MGLQETLRAGGYRLTLQRQLVLDAVDELGHATPEDVYGWVHERSEAVNVSTIYRTLELLEQLGLVRHTHLGHGPPTYHSAAVPEHVHLVCRECGGVTEVAPSAVQPLVRALDSKVGFEPDVGHLALFGTCRKCRS